MGSVFWVTLYWRMTNIYGPVNFDLTAQSHYQASRRQGNGCPYNISLEQLKLLQECGFTTRRMGTLLGVSGRTVHRRLKYVFWLMFHAKKKQNKQKTKKKKKHTHTVSLKEVSNIYNYILFFIIENKTIYYVNSIWHHNMTFGKLQDLHWQSRSFP